MTQQCIPVVMVANHLFHCASKRATIILKQDHQRTTKIARRLKHTLYKKQLKEFGLFSMEKRRSSEDVIANFYFLMGDYSEDISRFLSEVYSK